jgi:hypothetical protein
MAMTPMTAFDLPVADHHARISRINQQGWMWRTPQSAGATPISRMTTVPAPIRQQIGASIVRVGEWLRGASASHASDRAAV